MHLLSQFKMLAIVGQEREIISQPCGTDQKGEVADRLPSDMGFVRFGNVVVVLGLSKGEQIHALWTYN